MKALFAAVLVCFFFSACAHPRAPRMTPEAAGSCRSDLARWYAPDNAAQRARLDSWCAGVGPTTMFNGAVQPAGSISPNDIAFVSWNVHEGNGHLRAFVEDLRAGRLTNGRAPQHFVLLLQEAVRTTGVPAYTRGAAGARRIRARDQDAEDIEALSRGLGLSLVYVPSMRNGNAAGDPNGDRGNAILSTLPLSEPMAIELPFERQRRVALFAHVTVSAVESLPVGVIHLDATDAAKHLWIFRTRSWRAIQARSLESLLPAGTLVVGADLNTWVGRGEPALRYFQRLFGGTRPPVETSRARRRALDYLFFRGEESATPHYEVIANKYGSDHHPLIGWFNN